MSEVLRESNMIELIKELNDNLEKEVVAFLNYREGGDIYIGVDDDGNAVALDNPDAIQCAVADRIKNNIQPATRGLFDVVKEKYQGKPILHIIVSSGAEKPYFIKRHGMSAAGCYIRIGTSSQPMTQSMIDELYAKRTHNSLQKIVSPRQNLTFEQLQIYYQVKGIPLNDKFAKNLDLLTEDGKYNYVAYLLADSNGVSMKVAKYAGKDKYELIEYEEYGYCSLIKATKSVLDRLNVENRTLAKITSKQRIERRLVNAIALREAVINAVVHNDYSLEVPPVFEIFSDRIEITSYGGLPMGLSKDDFFRCRSMPRNREIMRIFKDLGLVEQLGSGMSRILSVYDKSIFSFTSHFMTVCFDYTGEITPQASPQDTMHGEISKAILGFCREPRTIREIADKCGLKDLKHVTTRYLTPLLEQQYLCLTTPENPNNPKQKHETATPQATPQVTPQDTMHDEISKTIIDFCREPRTKKEIADKCGLKDLKHLTRRYLTPLIEQKYLRMTMPEKPTSSKQKYIVTL